MKLGRLRFRARITPTWFLGYQKYCDAIGTEWIEFFIVPPIGIAFGWHWH